MTTTYESVELHLNPEPLAPKHARQIKAASGEYSACRGNASKRFVTLPASARDLINDLTRAYGAGPKAVTIIARGDAVRRDPAWLNVQYVNPASTEEPLAQFERKYAKAYAEALARGLVKGAQ